MINNLIQKLASASSAGSMTLRWKPIKTVPSPYGLVQRMSSRTVVKTVPTSHRANAASKDVGEGVPRANKVFVTLNISTKHFHRSSLTVRSTLETVFHYSARGSSPSTVP